MKSISFWLLCICFYVSTGTSEWPDDGFSAFEVKVLDEHVLCVESIHSVSL